MEGRLQGPINPCFLEEIECLEQEKTSNNPKFGFGQFESPNDGFEGMRMPFLEMLQTGDSPAFSPFCELSFQALLSLQQFMKPPWDEALQKFNYTGMTTIDDGSYLPVPSSIPNNTQIHQQQQQRELKEQPDSCLTHDAAEAQISRVKSAAMDHHNRRDGSKAVELEERAVAEGAAKGQKRKKVKRTKATAKNKEEVESQRMTHIAVERNRRRQMNDHLTALRSLMPSSYIQRGDQASIVGGAIDYVKELEQLHESLQAWKRMKKTDLLLLDQSGSRGGSEATTSTSTSSSSTTTGILATSSPTTTSQCKNMKSEIGELGDCVMEGINVQRSYEFTAAKKSEGVEVNVTVIQNHVNLKVACPRKAGLLLNAIVALEDLGLTVLHLNIVASENSAQYSFNLKIEEECEIGSADRIAVVVHQIFSFIHRTSTT